MKRQKDFPGSKPAQVGRIFVVEEINIFAVL